MKIKEHLSVYLESGYLFDDMSGKLKWFEIDKILISFTYGVVRYVGTWGGCRAEKTLDGKLFYSSEERFLEAAEGYPVDVDLETQGFYRYNDAGTLPGECADFIFHKYND